MRLLIFGDIFGRIGRRMLHANLLQLKKQYQPDFCIANSENITSGRGPALNHIYEMQSLGFDVLTG